MARLNVATKTTMFTHEGAKAKAITPLQQLKRSVLSCMLWEKEFYEDGQSISQRISEFSHKVHPADLAALAVQARTQYKLRHVPLLLAKELASVEPRFPNTANVIEAVIQRPDELAEFLAIYWKDGKRPLSAQVKKGLARAFKKFNAYQLAKYNRDGAIKLRDVLFLCHAKPGSEEQDVLWKQLISNTLPVPETWETMLSAGKDKKETWEYLLSNNKLGGLALLRNLRNMKEANVNADLVYKEINSMKTDRILPFRFIAAAKYAPALEPYLENKMLECIQGLEKIPGHTCLLVDVSGSMDEKLSAKSDLTRLDAACGLAVLLREVCEHVSVVTFSNTVVPVPARRGFALKDVIIDSQPHRGTYLGLAIRAVYAHVDVVMRVNTYHREFNLHGLGLNPDRLVVITDEQSHDPVPDPQSRGYMINVASNKNGVGYYQWLHVDGFSEAVVNWITEYEKTERKEG